MNNKLELSQLQYLDALLKQIAYYSESKKDLKIVIMVADNLIAGDFMLYNSNKRPQIKDSQYDGITQYDIPIKKENIELLKAFYMQTMAL